MSPFRFWPNKIYFKTKLFRPKNENYTVPEELPGELFEGGSYALDVGAERGSYSGGGGGVFKEIRYPKLRTVLNSQGEKYKTKIAHRTLRYSKFHDLLSIFRHSCQLQLRLKNDINSNFINLFPANVPTREHDFLSVSFLLFHVENDVILRTSSIVESYSLKSIPSRKTFSF